MEGPAGILGRVGEKLLGWIALALLVAAGIAIWQMDPATKTAIWNGIWKSIAWVLVAAVLPWVSRLFIKRLLEIGENWVGIVLIAALTLVNVAFGLILLGGLPAGGWGWLAALAAAGVAGTYNFLVCEYLAETTG